MLDIKITQGRTAFLDVMIQGARLEDDIRKTIVKMTAQYRAAVIAELTAPKGGRRYGERVARAVYRRERRSVTLFGGRKGSYTATARSTTPTRAYTASAPGQAPASFSGTLARSVQAKVSSAAKGFAARVYADRRTAFYRHFLEFGTNDRSTRRPARNVGSIAPRPVWSRLQARIDQELPQRVGEAVRRFEAGGR